jgi:hypothetical protein
MKKIHFPWKKLGVGLLLAVLVAVIVMLYWKLSELVTQMAYLQDTTNVILSDVGNLQSNFEKTLEEENSLIESYTIDVVDMDFAAGTYDVEVAVIPKEYTDETKVSVYFGTAECPLAADGYTYTGAMTLPLEKTFDGNLTFLLANGKKKSTEVIDDYAGLYNHLDQVLTGSLAEEPVYDDGEVKLDSACTWTLDGAEIYEFESLEMVFELDGEEIGTIDLLTAAADAGVSEQDGDTEMDSDVSQIELPVSGSSSTCPCHFSYDLKEHLAEGEELPEDPQIRVFLRAVSTRGYRFESTLSGGNDRTVYDRKGGHYELSENMPEEDTE